MELRGSEEGGVEGGLRCVAKSHLEYRARLKVFQRLRKFCLAPFVRIAPTSSSSVPSSSRNFALSLHCCRVAIRGTLLATNAHGSRLAMYRLPPAISGPSFDTEFPSQNLNSAANRFGGRHAVGRQRGGTCCGCRQVPAPYTHGLRWARAAGLGGSGWQVRSARQNAIPTRGRRQKTCPRSAVAWSSLHGVHTRTVRADRARALLAGHIERDS